jgi:hypothetical protein
MYCPSCEMSMHYVGMDREGRQYFKCSQDGCIHQHKPMRRWWESGTDFQREFVE